MKALTIRVIVPAYLAFLAYMGLAFTLATNNVESLPLVSSNPNFALVMVALNGIGIVLLFLAVLCPFTPKGPG